WAAARRRGNCEQALTPSRRVVSHESLMGGPWRPGTRRYALKPFQFRKWQFSTVHMHGAVLGTAVQRRHRLARIQQAVFVEGRLDGVKLRQLVRAELIAHLADLLDADAVLTGDAAADLDAQLEDLRTQLLGAFQLTRP